VERVCLRPVGGWCLVARGWRRALGAACLALGAGCFAPDSVAQTPGPAPATAMPALPLTQLDDRTSSADFDNRTFTLTFAQPLAIRDLLLLLVRGTGLSVVPDPSIAGSFIGELKDVTVRQALGLILPPLGLEFRVDGSFVTVFKREPETRIFDLNYAATERTGSSIVGGADRPSAATVSSTTKTDIFGDVTKGVQALLSEHATFNVDRKAGLLQATDFPERLDRISIYLDAVQDRVHRQVQLDARVIEVEPNDATVTGVDWTVVAAQLTGDQTPAQRVAPRPSRTGLRVTDLARLMNLLEAQGKVSVVASPRLLTLNNEPAIVRTDAATFSVTPQIAGDGIVTLSLSPILNAPALAESDTIARVADGETLVLSGFMRDREIRERKTVGNTGGWFGRKTVVTNKRVELIILLTPNIVSGVGVQ
jgi:type II secretory pathway component HofQ